MADAAKGKEEISDLIQRLIESLALISDRFGIDRQKLRSITTFAALSVTFVFAWKILRAPPESQRRQPSRHNAVSGTSDSGPSGARSHSNSTFSATEVCTSSGDLKPVDAVDELTLEQLIRHKLRQGRKVTCQLLGVILEEATPEELQKHVTVRSDVRELLGEIAKFCDLYLMERILDDESEERVLSALDDAGFFTTGGLNRDKILFCSTETGRSSFVRQLEPDWHIDTNAEIIYQLSRFIKNLLHISPNRPERPVSSNVVSSTCLEQFFGGPDQS